MLEEQQDSNSPNYRAWLTPDQYADRFGLTPAELAKVTSWLEAQGFRVDYVSRSRTWVLFSGAAGQVQSAFHTELHSYEFNGTSHYANATDPSIPAELAPLVWLVRGLDDFRTQPPKPRVTPAPDFTSGGGHALTPGDVGTIYDINALYQKGFAGSGQKIAVVGQTDIYLTDIEEYRSQVGIRIGDQLIAQRNQQTLVFGRYSEESTQHLYGYDGRDPLHEVELLVSKGLTQRVLGDGSHQLFVPANIPRPEGSRHRPTQVGMQGRIRVDH